MIQVYNTYTNRIRFTQNPAAPRPLDKQLYELLNANIKLMLEGPYLPASGVMTGNEKGAISNALEEALVPDGDIIKKIKDDIKAIVKRDQALNEANKREALLYPSVTARFFHEVAHKLYTAPADDPFVDKKFIARAISQAARSMTGIEIHPGAEIGNNFFIDHGMGVVIGETAKVGNNVTLHHGVTLGGSGNKPETLNTSRHPSVGNGVFIGAHAQLIGNINIGEKSKIGANATVVKNIPPNVTVVNANKILYSESKKN